MADPFAKPQDRFSRDLPGSRTTAAINERQQKVGGNDLPDFKAEVLAERAEREALKNKERTEPTETKKKKGFLENLMSALPFGPKKTEQTPVDTKKDISQDLGGMTIQDVVAPIDMEIDFNEVIIGEWHYRTYFVSGYPRFVGPNWLSPIINFEHSLFISSFYYPVDTKIILQKLKKKIGELEATLYAQVEERKVVDPSMKVALTDAQQLQDAIAEGTEKFFHFGMYITIRARSEDELDKIGRNVVSTLASINVTAKAATLQQEQGLISAQPLGLDKLYITRNMDTTSLATTFPFVSSELTMDHGIMYGLNQHNKSLVVFDRFDLENANAVVFAKSGAGKSYYVKLEAVRSMMLGAEIIIIDPEKEYEPLCKAVNGAYISFSQDQGAKMNPFELSGLGDENDDELRMKMLSLQGFFKLMLGKLDSIESSILDRALILTYREKGITLDPRTQRNANYPLLEDLYKVLKGMAEPEARSIASRLEKYIIGSAAGVFNEKSTVAINNPFTVFSVRDMPEELRPLAMYLMLDYIWTKIRKDRKRRLLIVDEAWYMMQNEDSAKFMYGIAKRARKYYLGLSTITQDVDDFLNNDMGRAIITNSSMQFLMKQSPTAVEKLQKVFNLSEGEKQFLLNCDKGQGLFFAGQNHVAIQVVSSQSEHELITSDPKDLEMLEARQQEDTRTVEELSQLYESPAMQSAIKANVDFEKSNSNLERAMQSRRAQIQKMMDEKLQYQAVPKEGQPKVGNYYGTNPSLSGNSQENQSGFDPMKGEGTLTDYIAAQRQQLQQGRSHLTPQGMVSPSDNDDDNSAQ